MIDRFRAIWASVCRGARTALGLVGKYLDDLLLVAAGICVVVAVAELLGRSWALLIAGIWFAIYAWIVARAKGG